MRGMAKLPQNTPDSAALGCCQYDDPVCQTASGCIIDGALQMHCIALDSRLTRGAGAGRAMRQDQARSLDRCGRTAR
jgi:hypothetical protein